MQYLNPERRRLFITERGGAVARATEWPPPAATRSACEVAGGFAAGCPGAKRRATDEAGDLEEFSADLLSTIYKRSREFDGRHHDGNDHFETRIRALLEPVRRAVRAVLDLDADVAERVPELVGALVVAGLALGLAHV